MNLLSHAVLAQGSIILNLSNQYRTWEREAKIQILQRICLHVGVCCKPVLKVAKSLNQTFWATECWYKAQKCKILSTNTKLFFRWSEANLKTSWQLSPYIGVSYKFVLKSLFWKHKSNPLNHGIFFQGFIIPNLVNKYQTIFSWKRGWPWNSLERKVSSHIGVIYKFVFWVCEKYRLTVIIVF